MIVPAAAVAASKPFLIFGADDGPPKYFVENGKARGIVVDITAHCLNEIGLAHRIVLVPWQRAYSQAQAGVIGLSRNSERLAHFDYSEPIFTEYIVVLTRKDRTFAFRSVDDLKGKRIGVSQGSSYGDAYNKAVAKGIFEVHGFSNTANGLAMLQAGRLDAILLGSSAARDALRHSRNLAILPEPFSSDSKYLGIAKSLKMQPMLERFNACLAHSHRSHTFDHIIRQYGEIP